MDQSPFKNRQELSSLASAAPHAYRPKNNRRMADGCGFENWSKNIGADGWRTDDAFCDAVADEIIVHPRISSVCPSVQLASCVVQHLRGVRASY